jgi:hypothetical protein
MSSSRLSLGRAHIGSLALVMSVGALALSAGVASLAGQSGDGPPVHRVQVTGTIEMGLAPYVARALREAEEAGAAAVVLDLDTPGGRVDAAWEIIDAVRDAGLPVYAYVNRRALSAGAMIALSAEALYMRPGSTIGAATPITGEGRKASEKMVSAMRSEFRALAEERGFDPRIAEAMVDEEVEVEGVVPAGKLLTLTTVEALELGVATSEVQDYAALLAAVGLGGADTVDSRPNWAEQIVRFLTNPMVAPLLLSLGFLGLLIEIRTPTFGLAGTVGLLSLGAFFGARLIVNLAGRDVLDAVQVSVNPKVIQTPRVSAVAKDGIQLVALARVTVRANIDRLVGGAGEETILARVGEGIVSTIGSAASHKAVLENPDNISKTVLAKGLDAGTAFEILSIDIADVDVGKNIGAELQTDQAEADKRIAQAKAEERRAMAVASEQEMVARVQEMRAKVVEAEAQIPLAMADAFRDGNLGVMDYVKYRNVESDTAMRRSIAKGGGPSPTPEA